MTASEHSIAVFDIGKTNKKLVVFSDSGEVLKEESICLPETKDEDGFPCENLPLLESWIKEQWEKLSHDPSLNITGLNVATYGASLVHLDEEDKPLTPLYNYLKPFPPSLKEDFFLEYGPEENFILETASPYMGMLNSGLQLYWLKKNKPEVFKKIKSSLHLPQYLSFLISGKKVCDYTSVGCHTGLWDFFTRDYHEWVYKEELTELFPPFDPSLAEVNGVQIGPGIHDTSACIVPYLEKSTEPFILLSTGTWCIVLNPFDETPLTIEQIQKDCLQFFTPSGKPVKVARIFLGKEHDYQLGRMNSFFQKEENYFKQLSYPSQTVDRLLSMKNSFIPACMEGSGPLPEKQKEEWSLNQFENFEEAYFSLMSGLVDMLSVSIQLADPHRCPKIYIDGGFAKSKLFVQLLEKKFPSKEFTTSDSTQGTALGAMMQVRKSLLANRF